jgi:hypothetical protein
MKFIRQARNLFKRMHFVISIVSLDVSPAIPQDAKQGCQIFLGTTYQNMKKISQTTKNGHKNTKWPQHLPNGRKKVQIAKLTIFFP